MNNFNDYYNYMIGSQPLNTYNNNFDNNTFQNTFMNIDNSPKLYNPNEGFTKGNMFIDLYSQYKNYKPVAVTANNEREALMRELGRMAFAAHELNLYLDIHPDDTGMITLFNDYREKANQLMSEYDKKFGPLTINSNSLNQTPFMWEKDVWPWEVKPNV